MKMKLSTVHCQMTILLVIITSLTSCVAAVNEDYEVIEVDVKPEPLHCYRCYEYEPHCQQMGNTTSIEIRQCREEQGFCQIRTVRNRGSLTTFERSCTKDCTTECKEVLFIQQCVKCCNTTLCNAESGTQGNDCYLNVMLIAMTFSLSFIGLNNNYDYEHIKTIT